MCGIIVKARRAAALDALHWQGGSMSEKRIFASGFF